LILRPYLFLEEQEIEQNPYLENTEAQEIAARYCQMVGYPPPQPTPYIEIDPHRMRRIGTYYDRAESRPNDPNVQEAWAAFINEINLQFDMLPITILPSSGIVGSADFEYGSSREMIEDIVNNHRLYVFTGGDPNPLMSPEMNFKFRAVHDYFGHSAHGFAFGPRGELNAWIEYSKMFSPVARQALTTETVGQLSALLFGPKSHRTMERHEFPEQKAFILPEEFQTHPVLEEAYQDYPGFYPNVRVHHNPLEDIRPARGKHAGEFLYDVGKFEHEHKEKLFEGGKAATWCREPHRVEMVMHFFEHGLQKFPDSYLWYNNTRGALLDFFGDDVERTNFFILLLAATSPLTSVGTNIDLAFRALRLYDKWGSPVSFGRHAMTDEKSFRRAIKNAFPLKAHFDNVWRVTNNEPLKGPKVVSFAKNLFGDPNAVTVDRWVIRSFLTDAEYVTTERLISMRDDEAAHKALKKEKMKMERIPLSLYRCVRDLFRELAHRVGMEPRAFQAVVWTGVKDLRGSIEDDPPYPFDYYLIRYRDVERLPLESEIPTGHPSRAAQDAEFADFERMLAEEPVATNPPVDSFEDEGDGEFVLYPSDVMDWRT
jgi:hypothetical protein